MGKHGDGPVHEIYGSASRLGLLVHRGSRFDIIGNIRYMYAHFEIAVVKFDGGSYAEV